MTNPIITKLEAEYLAAIRQAAALRNGKGKMDEPSRLSFEISWAGYARGIAMALSVVSRDHVGYLGTVEEDITALARMNKSCAA